MSWMLLPLKRYAEFSGRSRRKEYWLFALFLFLLGIVAAIVDFSLGYSFTTHIVSPTGASYNWYGNDGPAAIALVLATIVPSLAVAVRRLHDIDKSGWWWLIVLVPLIGGIIFIVLLCLDGTRGPNRFGADPQGRLAYSGETYR